MCISLLAFFAIEYYSTTVFCIRTRTPIVRDEVDEVKVSWKGPEFKEYSSWGGKYLTITNHSLYASNYVLIKYQAHKTGRLRHLAKFVKDTTKYFHKQSIDHDEVRARAFIDYR